ncbi:MAG: hypothetical protein RBS53_11260 [Bacteroidales bacterium]|jgi:hypothetical protein|nr:hypothetical protein [Bacteroidales bacterium]
MKTIRKNFLLLAFAAGALFLIGNNVLADPIVASIIGQKSDLIIEVTFQKLCNGFF